MRIIALDVGGSSIKSGIVTFPEAAVTNSTSTPIDSTAAADDIVGALASVMLHHDASHATGIACAFPGPFDYDRAISHMRGLTKFDSLYGVPLRPELEQRLRQKVRIRFRNDAEAAVVGEALFGAGVGAKRVVGITLGTGMGSCFVEHGRPVTDDPRVPPHGWLYDAPSRSGRADDVFSSRGLQARLSESGGWADSIEASANRARAGDQSANEAFTAFGEELAEFLAPFVGRFDAERVLILGGLSAVFDLIRPGLDRGGATSVCEGTLDQRAALLGAASLFDTRR